MEKNISYFIDQNRKHLKINNLKITLSPTDNRQYRALLLDNRLKVLLISDPGISQASAALDVHVGSFSDPVDVPGIAHFAEHMCFLGTQKYPDEADFKYIISPYTILFFI